MRHSSDQCSIVQQLHESKSQQQEMLGHHLASATQDFTHLLLCLSTPEWIGRWRQHQASIMNYMQLYTVMYFKYIQMNYVVIHYD